MARREFIEAAKAAAFTCEDGRQIIHCIGRICGADWDLDDVVREIETADAVQWGDHIIGHDLMVKKGRFLWSFGVKRPEVAA